MKKASQILLTISFILGLLGAIACIVAGVVFAVLIFVAPDVLATSEITLAIQEIISEMEIDEETLAIVIKVVVAVVYFVLFLFAFILLLIAAIIAKKGAKAKRNGILIANIIFGLMSQNYLTIIGAVLGIVGLKMDARKAAQPQAQAEPAATPVEQQVVEQPKQVEEQPKQVEEQPQEVEQKPVRTDWYCPNCGAHNSSKFCQSCGTKRPE